MYPDVLLLNCTYKSNKLDLPLLHITGKTGHGGIYTSAFIFMAVEMAVWYKCALHTLKKHIHIGCTPVTILTDQDLGLALAVANTFTPPGTTHLLCQWHIMKNIQSNCQEWLGKMWYDAFMKVWRDKVLYAPSAAAARCVLAVLDAK